MTPRPENGKSQLTQETRLEIQIISSDVLYSWYKTSVHGATQVNKIDILSSEFKMYHKGIGMDNANTWDECLNELLLVLPKKLNRHWWKSQISFTPKAVQIIFCCAF